jgi:hypothetical protein
LYWCANRLERDQRIAGVGDPAYWLSNRYFSSGVAKGVDWFLPFRQNPMAKNSPPRHPLFTDYGTNRQLRSFGMTSLPTKPQSVPEADRPAYVAAYSRPGRMRERGRTSQPGHKR